MTEAPACKYCGADLIGDETIACDQNSLYWIRQCRDRMLARMQEAAS